MDVAMGGKGAKNMSTKFSYLQTHRRHSMTRMWSGVSRYFWDNKGKRWGYIIGPALVGSVIMGSLIAGYFALQIILEGKVL
jgi:hypothetical protein